MKSWGGGEFMEGDAVIKFYSKLHNEKKENQVQTKLI